MDEFRDTKAIKNLVKLIAGITKREWNIMEICGGQTHTILKYNLKELLPEKITLLHGPGCPVCVTPVELIDTAISIASRKDSILVSYGDMLRVPGTKTDLLSVKAVGGNVKIVYSPLDTLKIAELNPDKNVVFFAVGFETTAPANAMSIIEAEKRKIYNYSVICSQVLVPPALKAILGSGLSKVNGVLAAGHVCAVMGYKEYLPVSDIFKIPIVVTGFEPFDLLQGIYMTVMQLEKNQHFVENQYKRIVSKQGNVQAQLIINEVFEISDRMWRGIGIIPESGLELKNKYAHFDAKKIFVSEKTEVPEPSLCIAGEVLRGIKKPVDCKSFSVMCNPEKPLGAPMVSSEGACSAYYRYSNYLK